MDLAPGTLIDGKYRVGRPIGKGGMGAVYEAENVRVRKTVAVKVLSAHAAEDVVRRFEHEAQAAGQIGSEHIVEVHDLGTMPTGEPYMVMEYLEGETLRARLQRDVRLPVEAALPILVQLLEGLAAAHAAGIVHRDLKPENIYLVAQRGGLRDWVKILDFGISKFASVGDEGVTRTGQVIGTPQYMAPEQIKAPQLVDGRTDLYAVGVVFYQLITGQIPFKAKTYAELLFKVVYEPLPHPTTLVPGLDPSACDIVLRAMARDPEQRFPTALAMRDALMELATRMGALMGGESTSSTGAFLRATGTSMPLVSAGTPSSGAWPAARGPGGAEGRGTPFPQPAPGAGPPSHAAGTPVSTPHGASPMWSAGFGQSPATTQLLQPAVSSTPHPALRLPGPVPTPNPSFGGVPLATNAPGPPDGGRKAALAVAAAIVAVGIGVLGFVVSRPAGPDAAAGPGAPSGAIVGDGPAAATPPEAARAGPDVAADPPGDDPAPAASPSSRVAAQPDTTPTVAASVPSAGPTSPAAPPRPAATGSTPPRPTPARPPKPSPTSVLGY